MLGQNEFASCRFSHGQIDEPRFVPLALKLISPFTLNHFLCYPLRPRQLSLRNYFSRDVGAMWDYNIYNGPHKSETCITFGTINEF